MAGEMNESSFYTAQRQEITQTLFAFRQLLVGELAGYAALIGAVLTIGGAQSVSRHAFPAIIAIDLLIAFLAVTTTLIGDTWLGTVYRQASYILVAIEVPSLIQSGIDTKERGALWIMANRSEALFRKGKKSKGRTVPPGRELQSFVIRQIGLFAVATIITAIVVLTRYKEYSASQSPLVNDVLIGFAIAITIITLAWLGLELARSGDRLVEVTKSWVEYVKNRNDCDKALLASYGIDLTTDAESLKARDA